MIIKQRGVPKSLRIRRFLKARMALSGEDLKQLAFDEKGLEGECRFDQLIAQSPASTYLQLQDLFLEWRNSPFQIDSLLWSPHKIYLLDIKNFDGEVYIEGDRWFYLSGRELKNPIPQLNRCESLLRQLLQSLGVNLLIEAYIIFVNPEFTLFQTNRNHSIILPTQVNSFIRKLGSVSPKSYNQNLIESAKKLALLHNEDSPSRQSRIPNYSIDTLKPGIPCDKCGTFLLHMRGRELICDICEYRESVTSGVLRNVEEHKLLLPDRFITVAKMVDWCGLDLTQDRMQRILKKHYSMVGIGRSTYYL